MAESSSRVRTEPDAASAEGRTPQVPPYFGLEVTRRCNLRCPHCYVESGPDAPEGMSFAELRQIVIELGSLGLRRLALVGGEPLLRDDLEELMRAGRGAGIESYSLVTNGSLATAKRARSLGEAGLRAVQISIDGVDAQAHGATRGQGRLAFYRALRAVRLFREAGVRVDIATLIDRRTVDRADESVALLQALGARWLRYCSFVPAGRARDPAIRARIEPDPEQLDRFFERLRGWRARGGKRLGLLVDHAVGPWTTQGALTCRAGTHIGYVTANGDLYPCTGLLFDPFRVGNVLERPLVELLRSPAMRAGGRVRRSELAEPCRSCPNRRCSGGCRGAVYAATGDRNGAPPYCNVWRRLSGVARRGSANG